MFDKRYYLNVFLQNNIITIFINQHKQNGITTFDAKHNLFYSTWMEHIDYFKWYGKTLQNDEFFINVSSEIESNNFEVDAKIKSSINFDKLKKVFFIVQHYFVIKNVYTIINKNKNNNTNNNDVKDGKK